MRDSTTGHPHRSGAYEIRVEGHLDSRWAAWFDGMTLTKQSDDTTVLQDRVIDQAALYGLLGKLRDVGLTLLSVTPVEPSESGMPTTKP